MKRKTGRSSYIYKGDRSEPETVVPTRFRSRLSFKTYIESHEICRSCNSPLIETKKKMIPLSLHISKRPSFVVYFVRVVLFYLNICIICKLNNSTILPYPGDNYLSQKFLRGSCTYTIGISTHTHYFFFYLGRHFLPC